MQCPDHGWTPALFELRRDTPPVLRLDLTECQECHTPALECRCVRADPFLESLFIVELRS
jgi:hypothetical protein